MANNYMNLSYLENISRDKWSSEANRSWVYKYSTKLCQIGPQNLNAALSNFEKYLSSTYPYFYLSFVMPIRHVKSWKLISIDSQWTIENWLLSYIFVIENQFSSV